MSLSIAYANPYQGQDLFGFFVVLFKRLMLLITGQLGDSSLTTDELQMVVLSCLSISAALVGGFLMLRKMAMAANTLSHTVLLGIVIAFLITRASVGDPMQGGGIDLKTMAIAALITGIATTFLMQLLMKVMRLQSDAANGIVFSALFSLGVTLVTLFTRNVHLGIEVVIGNVDGLHRGDMTLAASILGMNLILFFLLFRPYRIMTFDSQLARALGVPVTLLGYLLMIQAAATVIGAFRAVGVVMVLAFLVGLPLIARRYTHRLHRMLLFGSILGVVVSVVGVAVARHCLTVYRMPLSTGGIVVCLIVALYLLSVIFDAVRALVIRRQRQLRNST